MPLKQPSCKVLGFITTDTVQERVCALERENTSLKAALSKLGGGAEPAVPDIIQLQQAVVQWSGERSSPDGQEREEECDKCGDSKHCLRCGESEDTKQLQRDIEILEQVTVHCSQ